VLTSHFRHPLVSPYTLLASVDNLTSRLNGEEGDWVAMGMGVDGLCDGLGMEGRILQFWKGVIAGVICDQSR
jgi:hypothetical protein